MRIHRLLAGGLAVTAAVIVSDSAAAAAGPIVPADYTHAVATAPLLCRHYVVDADLVAHQLYGESRFETCAVSAAGAQGPAQLTPAMFVVYGADDDHNGTATPFDITDAVSAMVRVDCRLATQLLERGRPADRESIVAAYTGGIDAVDDQAVRDQARRVLR